MEQFLEYPLVLQLYPSLPCNSEIGIVSSTTNNNKKSACAPRKILKAKRMIKKQTEANSEAPKELRKRDKIHSTPNVLIPSPSGSYASIIPFRAIQKSDGKNNLNVRVSDYSFLENERLCEVEREDNDDEHLNDEVEQLEKKELTFKPNIKECTNNVLQKRKLSEKMITLTKKRRTLEGDGNKRPNVTKFVIGPLNTPNICKRPLKPKPKPNFSRIFQIQYENSENILEYKERKAERAAHLLSGAKPPPQLQTPIIKKELTFTTEDSPNIAKLPRLPKDFICTPYPRNRKKYEERDGNEINSNNNDFAKKFAFIGNDITNRLRNASKTKLITNSTGNNITKRLQNASKTKVIPSSTPYSALNVRSNFFYNMEEHIGNKKHDIPNSKVDYKTRGLKYKHVESVLKETPKIETTSKLFGKRTNKVIVPVKKGTTEILSKCAPNTKTVFENKACGNKISKIPVILEKESVQTNIGSKEVQNVAKATHKSLNIDIIKPAVAVNKMVNIVVDLKSTNKKLHRAKKDDLVKAIQTKSRVQEREITASGRHNIKGVRLNRRFELLMQMRCNDN